MLLIIHICSGNVKFDDPCHYNFTVINQRYNISSKPEKAQNLSDILRLTIDYKVRFSVKVFSGILVSGSI